MKNFSYVVFVLLGVAMAGFSADAPGTTEQCAELERQLADFEQLISAYKLNLEKLNSALGCVQEVSKIITEQYDVLKMIETQPNTTLRGHINILGEIAGNRAAFAANEQAIGGLVNAIASARSQISLREKEYNDRRKEYTAKCKPVTAP